MVLIKIIKWWNNDFDFRVKISVMDSLWCMVFGALLGLEKTAGEMEIASGAFTCYAHNEE